MKAGFYCFLLVICILIQSCVTIEKTSLKEKKSLANQPSDFIFVDRNSNKHTTEVISSDNQNSRKIINTVRDKKGKIIKTIFSGAVLVRQIINKNGIDTVKISITGNATIRHNNVVIRASKMTIDDNRIGKLHGKIKITDNKSGVKIFSNHAIYDRDKQSVILSGNPYMLVRSKSLNTKKQTIPALVSCYEMIRDLKKKESILKKDVRIHQDSWTLLGNSGVYQDGSDQIILDDKPYIFGANQFLTGENLKYTISKKQAELDNKIIYLSNGIEQLQKQQNGNKTMSLESFGRLGGKFPKKIPKKARQQTKNILTSHKIIFVQENSNKEAITIASGNVLLTRENLKVKAEDLRALGKNFHTLYTQTGVEIYDFGRDIHAIAGVLDYSIKKKFLRLEQSPILEFYKKGTRTVESTLKSAVIERNFDDDSMVARGNVHLERQGFEAIGETAKYFDKEGYILIEGNPGIVNQNSIIRSEKILYYIESKRVFLYNRIRGYLGMR